MSRRRSRSPSPARYSRSCSSSDPRDLERRIFVGNLPTSDMEKKDLEDMFSPYGKVIGVSMFRGFGFVQFERIEEAEAAKAAQKGRIYKGYKIDVNMAVERRQPKPQSQQSPPRRAPYSSYGDSKEPRPRSRSPAYGREARDGRDGRDGRESQDGRDGRDSGREARPSRDSRDHDYRYRGSESRDKDARGDAAYSGNVSVIQQRRVRPILPQQQQHCRRLLPQEGGALQGPLHGPLEWTPRARRGPRSTGRAPAQRTVPAVLRGAAAALRHRPTRRLLRDRRQQGAEGVCRDGRAESPRFGNGGGSDLPEHGGVPHSGSGGRGPRPHPLRHHHHPAAPGPPVLHGQHPVRHASRAPEHAHAGRHDAGRPQLRHLQSGKPGKRARGDRQEGRQDGRRRAAQGARQREPPRFGPHRHHAAVRKQICHPGGTGQPPGVPEGQTSSAGSEHGGSPRSRRPRRSSCRGRAPRRPGPRRGPPRLVPLCSRRPAVQPRRPRGRPERLGQPQSPAGAAGQNPQPVQQRLGAVGGRRRRRLLLPSARLRLSGAVSVPKPVAPGFARPPRGRTAGLQQPGGAPARGFGRSETPYLRFGHQL
ncbi:nuclear receptor coactivator 5 isoform X7 [Brachyistius frenatus]|uniref:nuclear receptor coactivator 5 isoform X7 n=1 Tax=Brachyistius frenatus TaxID=100188 RepID=UPI0037E822FE